MTSDASLWIHVIFLMFVAIAVYAQTLTGFALSLILLGLIGATSLVPLPDAVNASTVIGGCAAWFFLYRRRPVRFERVLLPSLITNAIGTIVGVVLLTWLAGTAYEVLRLTLGVSIVACALILWRTVQTYTSPASSAVYAVTGGISGLMAGMFSTPGPPMVYLLYRQPMSHAKVRESLALIFGLGTALRLLIVVSTGQFSFLSLLLAIEALPVVMLVTSYAARRSPPVSFKALKALVCALLVGTGVSVAASAASALM